MVTQKHIANASRKKGLFGERIQFVTILDQILYIGQITQIAPDVRTFFELPSNIYTMWKPDRLRGGGTFLTIYSVMEYFHAINLLINH